MARRPFLQPITIKGGGLVCRSANGSRNNMFSSEGGTEGRKGPQRTDQSGLHSVRFSSPRDGRTEGTEEGRKGALLSEPASRDWQRREGDERRSRRRSPVRANKVILFSLEETFDARTRTTTQTRPSGATATASAAVSPSDDLWCENSISALFLLFCRSTARPTIPLPFFPSSPRGLAIV